MIIDREIDGKRRVTIYEPIIVYEFEEDGVIESSIAGQRRLPKEAAERIVIDKKLQEQEAGKRGGFV